VSESTIVVMKGDQTGQEMLEEALRVLDPSVIRCDLTFETYDLSLESRRLTANQIVHQAARRVRETGLGIKAATITPGDPDDVGSPNALLRELLAAQVRRQAPPAARSTRPSLRRSARACAQSTCGGKPPQADSPTT
jgi:isocitrate dehydrogenase